MGMADGLFSNPGFKLLMKNFKEKANFLWSIADLLRGHYEQADYGKVR
jgi:hypothetical protein